MAGPAPSSNTNASPITATSAITTNSATRNPCWLASRTPINANDATAASTAPAHSGSPNTRLNPMAAPMISAMSVAIIASSAASHSTHTTGRLSRSRHSVATPLPVAMPSLAATTWIRIAIRLASTITHSSAVPYRAPPSMLVAQLPGSM